MSSLHAQPGQLLVLVALRDSVPVYVDSWREGVFADTELCRLQKDEIVICLEHRKIPASDYTGEYRILTHSGPGWALDSNFVPV